MSIEYINKTAASFQSVYLVKSFFMIISNIEKHNRKVRRFSIIPL